MIAARIYLNRPGLDDAEVVVTASIDTAPEGRVLLDLAATLAGEDFELDDDEQSRAVEAIWDAAREARGEREDWMDER